MHERHSAADSVSPQVPAPLWRDRSFWGLLCTQLLGAFNDNVYKTTVALLLVAVPDGALRPGSPTGTVTTRDFQGEGDLLFGLPFLLFSGWAGHLSDRHAKRDVFLACKLAEIAIMLLGLALLSRYGAGPMTPPLLGLFLLALFLLGTHSAFFGPGKYGVLPELFHEEQLPRANGVMLMTTFIAILVGIGVAGGLKDALAGRLGGVGALCCCVAVLGTLSALLIRPTPPAQRLPAPAGVGAGALFVPKEIRVILGRDRALRDALLASSLFWMAAGMVKSSVIALGKLQLLLSDGQATWLLSAVSLGTIVGAPLAGWLSRGTRERGVLRTGAAGIVLGLVLLSVPAGARGQLLGYAGSFLALITIGIGAGLLSVPLQVRLQRGPPRELKGRMIATMNLCNFLGIVLGGPAYSLTSALLHSTGQRPSAGFLVPAALMLLVALRL